MSAQPEPFTNHLIHEKSPYLRQHAHDPVDWYPWGEEAFERARSEEKPIFLSIGYATCHWCHVMHNESFENPEIARLMNDTFVNIKVDREELPHIDSIYMEFAQALMASSGGWPLNMILTPELKPFFAVTYLPPHGRQGLIGFDQFIMQIKQLWHGEERMQLIEQADKLVETFAHSAGAAGDEMPDESDIQIGVEVLFELSDPVNGGLRGEPKFPMGYQLEFLLQIAKSKSDSRALFAIELTLEHMYRGGIYDHLGGGFARYSVDERWTIPHFEKMTYDNAILARAYLEAWKYTKKPLFRQVSEETLDFMLREMMHKDGGFYSGLDADTDGHEGIYYTWTPEEVRGVLEPAEAELFCGVYHVTTQGNFEGRNVLHLALSLEEMAAAGNMQIDELTSRLAKSRAKLLQARGQRKRPFRDEKILCSWSALMIDALARAAAAFDRPEYLQAALKSAEFIKRELWKEGRLYRRICEGEAKFSAVLEDYAFLIRALLTLFSGGHGAEWLTWAMELADILEKRFKAPKGAFFQTEEEVIVRKCDFYDGAEPSGNGVHCENLLRLYQITHKASYLNQAEDIFKTAKGYMETFPPGACYHFMALQRYLDVQAPTLVIALDKKGTLEQEIRKWLSGQFAAHLEVIWKAGTQLDRLLPEEADKTPIEERTAVYLCRQNVCEPVLTSAQEIEKAIVTL